MPTTMTPAAGRGHQGTTAAAPPEPAFVLAGVTKRFGGGGGSATAAAAALAGVDLRVERGEHVALIGPSGAGKSTLLGLLNGSLLPTTGTVRVLGNDLARLGPAARRRVQRRIGTVYQQHHLVENLRVIHNVNAGRLGRWSSARALWSLLAWPQEVPAARDALDRVGIEEALWARTGHLSVGQQQRVALARVLVQDPDVILADEPVAALDPERALDVLGLLRDLGGETGKTLVVSLHQVEMARSHFERIVGLRAGRIVFDGPPAELTPPLISSLYRLEGDRNDRPAA